jgi:hypothetical protein
VGLDTRLGQGLAFLEGRHERAFLEPEHVKHDDTMELLKGYIVAATGKAPIEFAGTLNKSTRGTGAALAN